MKLKDLEHLFGCKIETLKKESKNHQFRMWLLYIVDALLMAGGTAFLFYNGVRYEAYVVMVVVVCLAVNFILYYKLDPSGYESYRFWRRNKMREVETVTITAGSKELLEVLVALGLSKNYKDIGDTILKDNDGVAIEGLQSTIMVSCKRDTKAAIRALSELMRFQVPGGNMKLLVCQRGKKRYLVGFDTERST